MSKSSPSSLEILAKRLSCSLREMFPEQARTLSEQIKAANRYASYRDRPAAFARDFLKFTFTPAQERMGEGLLVPPYRVLAPSGNEQGKTAASAALALWWHCTRKPAVILTTAPKFDQVRDLLWKEMRRLAAFLPDRLPFLPRDCRIERAADDFAVGVTARDATSFQGHHGPNQLFIFDEGTGIDGEFFEAVESMFSPPGHAWLVIFNPTTTSSRVYIEYTGVEASTRRGNGPGWTVVRMSAYDHPNIAAELAGLPPPVPHAMRVAKFERLLVQWSQLSAANPCLPVGSEGGPEAGDVIWPPLDAIQYQSITGMTPRVYRPGPEAQARLLAKFPDQSATGVWGDGDWMSACRELPGQVPLEIPIHVLPELGCDVARFGDDQTEIHARCGPVSLLHESASKRPTDQTAGRLIELARWLADDYNTRKDAPQPSISPEQIPIKIDDSGVGGAVTDILAGKGYHAVPVIAQQNANDGERYPNSRSELWFVTAERARRGEIDLSRLDSDVKDELRRQALTATWKLDSDGRRVVLEKDKIKAEIGRSPDGIDACNLAYYSAGEMGVGASTTTLRRNPTAGIFG